MDKILRYSDESMCWEYFKMSGSKNCESLRIHRVFWKCSWNFGSASLSRLTILLKNKSDIYFHYTIHNYSVYFFIFVNTGEEILVFYTRIEAEIL